MINVNGSIPWLRSVGLDFDPFVPLEAENDPVLSTYMVDEPEYFDELWRDCHTFMFASAGSGKTAFRVRLAHAVRSEAGSRKVLGVTYVVAPAGEASHLANIARSLGQEVLLRLLYRPWQATRMRQRLLDKITRAIEWSSPGLLDHFLPEIGKHGSMLRFVKAMDPSAQRMPGVLDETAGQGEDELSSRRRQQTCELAERLYRSRRPQRQLGPYAAFHRLLKLVREALGYEAIYLLLDNVDGWPETRSDKYAGRAIVEDVIGLVAECEYHGVYLKAFLPENLKEFEPEWRAKLTEPVKSTTIQWNSQKLVELLRARLHAASKGSFDTLDVVSPPKFRNVEEKLVYLVSSLRPRDALRQAHWLLMQHCRQENPPRQLSADDFEAVGLKVTRRELSPISQ